MKLIRLVFACCLAAGLCGCATHGQESASARSTGHIRVAAPGMGIGSPVKLLRITAWVDGSDMFVFTRDKVTFRHKFWSPPSDVTFDGKPWTNLNRSPAEWRSLARSLDLTRAWIVERKGRDTIALETTPSGFNLSLCDSPGAAAEYEVTIAVPRRK